MADPWSDPAQSDPCDARPTESETDDAGWVWIKPTGMAWVLMESTRHPGTAVVSYWHRGPRDHVPLFSDWGVLVLGCDGCVAGCLTGCATAFDMFSMEGTCDD